MMPILAGSPSLVRISGWQPLSWPSTLPMANGEVLARRQGCTMTDLIALHRRAVDQFGAAVRAIRPEQWSLPTPCADWNVRALVNHLVYESLWTAPLLEGKPSKRWASFEGDLL